MQRGAILPLSFQERQQPEQQLGDFREPARNAVTRLNVAITTAGLPEELLLEIFKWCIQLEQYTTKSTTRVTNLKTTMVRQRVLSGTYGWLFVTHVCQHWRNVALLSPSLWISIKITSFDCVRAFLDRSQMLPLAIQGSVDLDKQNDIRTWELIYRQSVRIQSLVFSSYSWRPGCLYDKLAAVLPPTKPSFPILKSLKVLKLPGDDPWLPFRLQPFGVSLAILEELDIADLTLSIIAHICPSSLKHLALRRFDHYEVRSLSEGERWKSLGSLLRSLPVLQTLTVEDGLPQRPAYTHDDMGRQSVVSKVFDPPVALPRLHTLHILSYTQYQAIAVAKLIVSLVIPSLGQLHVRSTHMVSSLEDQESRAIGAAVGQQLASATTRTPICTIWIKREHRTHYGRHPTILGWTGHGAVLPFGQYSADILRDIPPILNIHCHGSSVNSLVSRLVPYLPLKEVQILVLGDFYEDQLDVSADVSDRGTWMEVLGPAEDVRFLLVCGATAMDLSAALRPQVGMRQPLFPKLKQLKLVQVAFDGVFVPHDRNGYRWGNEWFTEFMGALEARSALDPGLQLEKLYIQDAKNVTVGMVEELEKYVLEVVLDSLPDDESQNHTCMESHVGNSR